MITRRFFETRRFIALDQQGQPHRVIEQQVLVTNALGKFEPAAAPFVYETEQGIELTLESDGSLCEIEGMLKLIPVEKI